MHIRQFFAFLFLAQSMTVSAQKPGAINFYLTPSISADLLNSKGAQIKDFLEKETGLTIALKVPKTYDDLVENFGTQTNCFAMMNSQSYILANTKHGAVVKLRTKRFSHSTYQGMIIVHASSGIKTVKDLQGKTMAYTDELSTSGYLYPKKILERSNIVPEKELFLKKHDEVVRQVYERKVDAGAAFYSPPSSSGELRDARGKLKEKYPDIEQKVVILAVTDAIPNDPVVFAKSFDNAIANQICMALIKLSQDEKGKQLLLDLYGIEGFVKSSDADYVSLRQVVGVFK